MSDRTQTGTKAKRIQILQEKGFKVPYTKIVTIDEFRNIKKEDFDSTKVYIARPSVIGEDSSTSSMAGVFKSIGPISVTTLIAISKKNVRETFRIGNHKLASIIIQEFIQGEVYGVCFSKNPQNLLTKGGFDIGKNFDSITSGKKPHTGKIGFITKQKIHHIGARLEKLFEYPQDIEFAIKGEDIFILQSRDITTGNNFYPEYKVISHLSGIYYNIDNDEFGEVKYLSSSFLSGIFSIVIIANNVYGRQSRKKVAPKYIKTFTKKYLRYLRLKLILGCIGKLLFIQKPDIDVMKKLYKKYNYSFDICTSSHIPKKKYYHGNLKTKIIVYLEHLKRESFIELEKVKQIILADNKVGKDIRYLNVSELKLSKDEQTQIIQSRKQKNGQIYQNLKYVVLTKGVCRSGMNPNKSSGKKWIYQGKMDGEKVHINDMPTLKKTANTILMVDSISDNFLDQIERVKGIIFKNGSIYSHNAIILRELKIPSYIIDSKL